MNGKRFFPEASGRAPSRIGFAPDVTNPLHAAAQASLHVNVATPLTAISATPAKNGGHAPGTSGLRRAVNKPPNAETTSAAVVSPPAYIQPVQSIKPPTRNGSLSGPQTIRPNTASPLIAPTPTRPPVSNNLAALSVRSDQTNVAEHAGSNPVARRPSSISISAQPAGNGTHISTFLLYSMMISCLPRDQGSMELPTVALKKTVHRDGHP